MTALSICWTDPNLYTDRVARIWYIPFLQEEFVKITGRNITPLVSFDDFFTTRQFYGYIVKDHDLQNRELKDVSENPVYIKQEQDRIENEILNFEQDLWSY